MSKKLHYRNAPCRNSKHASDPSYTPRWEKVTCRDCAQRGLKDDHPYPRALIQEDWALIGERILYVVDKGQLAHERLARVFQHIHEVIRFATLPERVRRLESDPCGPNKCEVLQ